MPEFTLTDAMIWVDGLDATGYSNKVSLKAAVDEHDSTVFGMTHRRRKGGLKNVQLGVEGFADDTAAPDEAAFAALGLSDRPVTIGALSPEGSKAYLYQGGGFGYEAYGAVGELAPFTLDNKSTSRHGMALGMVAKAKGNVAATGVLGSTLQVGAGGAGKLLYATLHVFSAATTITVQVQSSATLGGAYTTRGTLGPLTAKGAAFLTPVDLAAITDSWWRFNVSAITGTFQVAGAIAVQ